MLNPNNDPLKIVRHGSDDENNRQGSDYPLTLAILALSEAMMAKHKQSALPHFIALVKELEDHYGFTFEKE